MTRLYSYFSHAYTNSSFTYRYNPYYMYHCLFTFIIYTRLLTVVTCFHSPCALLRLHIDHDTPLLTTIAVSCIHLYMCITYTHLFFIYFILNNIFFNLFLYICLLFLMLIAYTPALTVTVHFYTFTYTPLLTLITYRTLFDFGFSLFLLAWFYLFTFTNTYTVTSLSVVVYGSLPNNI